MTEHEHDILQHILDGGRITNTALNETILIDYLGSSEDYNWDIPLTELGSFEFYYTKDQLTIKKLQQELADMTDKLKEIQTQKKKLGANLREVNGSGPKPRAHVYRSHLSHKEVKEIEKVFTHDFSTPATTVMKAYGVSQPVASKIRLAKHGKSSVEYRNHLRNIGQLRD
jgi:hypothetical protein